MTPGHITAPGVIVQGRLLRRFGDDGPVPAGSGRRESRTGPPGRFGVALTGSARWVQAPWVSAGVRSVPGSAEGSETVESSSPGEAVVADWVRTVPGGDVAHREPVAPVVGSA